MHINRLLLSVTAAFFTIANCAIAAQNNNSISLEEARKEVVKRYIVDLQKADYKDIAQLFDQNGIVISTSRGKVNAKEFFYSFLPDVASANTETHQYFIGDTDVNRIAIRFHFSFKLKDGEKGDGEYVDEFVFSNNDTKLSAVYMFENIKF
ncbi:MAG: hypothetical protein A3E84_03160 [Gammaproteobacteria bacterium RIFCSPHIGHO2_12_FULL_42_13]|nr:MAG: hypothetical protein A3E84_03160 [Gammaproteobacteria bacterium RIFCSPHIGHO2_12_FULL_42_13]